MTMMSHPFQDVTVHKNGNSCFAKGYIRDLRQTESTSVNNRTVLTCSAVGRRQRDGSDLETHCTALHLSPVPAPAGPLPGTLAPHSELPWRWSQNTAGCLC